MAGSQRRNFLKAAGVATVGIGAASSARAQLEQIPPPPKSLAINRQAKAVLPGGQIADRAQIMQKLGLDPATPPDAWLAIFSCGSNAAGLSPAELKGIVQRGVVKQNDLDAHSMQKLRGQ